jgi:hypothetical protein
MEFLSKRSPTARQQIESSIELRNTPTVNVVGADNGSGTPKYLSGAVYDGGRLIINVRS